MALWGRLMAKVRGTTGLEPLARQDWLDQAADMGAARCDRYRLYQEFYDGDHGALLRDRARQYLETTGVPFCENFADVSVDAVAERLKLIGFTSTAAVEQKQPDGSSMLDDPVARQAEEWWQQARMDGLQPVVHTQTLICGDEYLIVEWDADRGVPRFCRQHQHQVKLVRDDDDPDTVEYAAKVWATRTKGPSNPAGRQVRRLNVYWPDHVEKWFRIDEDKGVWTPWQTEAEPWPAPWVDSAGNPLGVPVIQFRHRALGSGNGRSRIKPVIPFQEQLNKYVADLNDLVDNHALPQDWATGITGDTTFKRVAGNLWQSGAAEAKFGRLDASPTSNLLEAIEGVLSRLARRNRLPMHLLTGGTPPSGESLKTAESGLVSVVESCQVEFGNTWEDALLLAFRLDSTFGSGAALADGTRLEGQWANAETRSDKADLEAAQLKKNLGVSKHTLLGELGYDPEQEAERRKGEAEEAAAAFDSMLADPNPDPQA